MQKIISAVAIFMSLALPAQAQTVPCGGSFKGFVKSMKDAAIAKGHSKASVNKFFASVRQDPATLKADRAQGIFQRPFVDFSRRLISQDRINRGRAMLTKHAATFDRMEAEYGVSRGVLTAFWAFETDYGAFQGDFNTLNSLVTLSHDCRRPELFQPQVFAALELYEAGAFNPATSTGAWAGEIGMVQMLPGDIIEAGVDGNGDGKIDLRKTPEDALLSGANMLRGLGWRAGEPWLQEVTVPSNLNWGRDRAEHHEIRVRLGRAGRETSQREAGEGDPPCTRRSFCRKGARAPVFIAYPQFPCVFRVEPKLRLCDHRRLFCHPAGRRAGLQCRKS